MKVSLVLKESLGVECRHVHNLGVEALLNGTLGLPIDSRSLFQENFHIRWCRATAKVIHESVDPLLECGIGA